MLASIFDFNRKRRLRKYAWAALHRYWGVPYTEELTRFEHEGMLLLEREGKVTRDEGYSGREHWHRVR